MSMDESVRIAKFSVLVDEIVGLVKKGEGLKKRLSGSNGELFELFEKYHIDPSLLFIFDYDKLNKFAQIIMERCPISTRWNYLQWLENARANVFTYSDIDSIHKIKEFVKECVEGTFWSNNEERYKFIFWSLMILAVDKTEEDKHISLICNFAKMLDITDKEIQDMIHIVKLIFNKVDSDYEFQSDTIVEIFGSVLTKYNCKL